MSSRRPDDFDRGEHRRRAMLGDAWVARALGEADALSADFQSLVTRHAWNDVWRRPGLDDQTRRLLVLGMTMATAHWVEFELHCRAALRAGVAPETIRETLLQGAIYCGFPAANTAFKVAASVCRAEGVALPAAPLLADLRVRVHHTFSLPQLRVAVQGADEGIPVMLSHALGMSLAMWDELAAHLAPRHPVLRYDHRGQGGSAAVDSPYGIGALVDDAARLVREWGRGPVVFVGLSMGGLVGQGLAIEHPDLVRGLLLADTAAAFSDGARDGLEQRARAVIEGGMARIVDAVVERFLSAPTREARPALVAAVHAQLLGADPAGYAAAARAIRDADFSTGLANVRCPVRLVAGEHDLGTPPALTEAIAHAIGSAPFAVLPTAHLSVLEAPDAFAAEVDALIATLVARG